MGICFFAIPCITIYLLLTLCMESKYVSNWITQLKKGLIPLLVLKFLAKEATYGYDLLKGINEMATISITDGTLYPMLIKMYAEGLLRYEWVEQPSGIPRKYYTLTSLGEDALAQMDAYLQVFNHAHF